MVMLFIEIEESEEVLKKLILSENIKLKSPDLYKIFNVFKRFADMPVKCDIDTLEFFTGVSNPAGFDIFTLYFIRWFELKLTDELFSAKRLVSSFSYNPTPELLDLRIRLLSCQTDSRANFFSQVWCLDEFQIPATKYKVKSSLIYFSDFGEYEGYVRKKIFVDEK